MGNPLNVVGVDGARAGWIAVQLTHDHPPLARLYRTFAELLESHEQAQAIGVDIPIGLPTSQPREADALARAFIGPRASSVFPAPPREALLMPTYSQALAAARKISGKGISKQSYALRAKILEVDGLVRPGDRIYEVHPEVSFRALAGEPLPYSKKTWNGLMARRQLLEGAGILIPDDVGEAGSVAPDDLLDAAAAAWSASRIANGTAESLPQNPKTDERRRAGAIWY